MINYLNLSISARTIASVAVLLPLCAGFSFAQNDHASDWLMWGGSPERTDVNRNETQITRKNVGTLELKWKTQIDKDLPEEIQSGASMLTDPLVVTNVRTAAGTKTLVFTLSATNTLAALDASTGKIAWQRQFENKVKPVRNANWASCINTPTATPVIDKQKATIYAVSADGTLHALGIADGEEKMPPTDFVPAFARSWSLNLVDGVIYTTVGRGCGQDDKGKTPKAGMLAIDLNDPKHPVSHFDTSEGRPGGVWGRAGLVWSGNSMMGQTADGPFDPANNLWSQTLLSLNPKTLTLKDYFTPPNLELINTEDLDFGSGSSIAIAYQGRNYVVTGGKDGTLYILDANNLGGNDHRTPLFSLKTGNDELSYSGTGLWGALATVVNARGERWIYLPMWGPPSKEAKFAITNGDAPDGEIQAFRFELKDGKPVLNPMWISRNMSVPDPPVVVNGMVFATSTGENTMQRTSDPRYPYWYPRPDAPPIPAGQLIPQRAGPQSPVPGQGGVAGRAGLQGVGGPSGGRGAGGGRGGSGGRGGGAGGGAFTAQQRAQHTTQVILYAFDAATGKELYSSNDSIDDWTHLGSISVAGGKVYTTTRQSFVYAFGPHK
jgi:outer membrane protein assembly factor BamB